MTTTRHGTAVVTLPSDLEIRITRTFDAPVPLVFTAWTTPDLVRRWWGFESSPLERGLQHTLDRVEDLLLERLNQPLAAGVTR